MSAINEEAERKEQSISIRLLKAVLSIYILITVVITAYQMYQEFESEQQVVRENLISYEEIFGPSISTALWNLDEEQIEVTMDGLYRLNDTVAAVLVNAGGEKIYEKGIALELDLVELDAITRNPLQHGFQLNYKNRVIGTVYIFSSETIVFDHVKHSFINIALHAIFKTVVLWFLFLWAFRRYLLNSLEDFIGNVEKTDFSSVNDGALDIDTFGTEELHRLQRVFNDLKARIATSSRSLENMNQELEQRVIDRTEQLSRQSQLLEAMGEQGRIGAWEVDMLKETVYWSRITKEIHEVSQDYVPSLETGINFYKEGKSRDLITEMVQQAIEKGLPWNLELQLVTATGKEIWVAATGQAEMKAGKCVRLFGSFQDIDNRIKSQIALTAAKEAAEAADKAKSEFLASMSHEIRTPMNGVIGMLDILLNSKLPKQQKHQAEIALSSAHSLLNIINDILDFSKVEAGKLEIEHIDFNIEELFEESVEILALRAQEKGIELILDMTNVPDTSFVGDPVRLRQVLSNVLGNAVKFTEDGEIVVTAKTMRQENGQILFECAIKDTGIGIESSRLENIFGSFTQVDASMSRRFGGTGLGLAIAKKLCELMGGEVSVVSEVGVGSIFTFSVLLGMGANTASEKELPGLQNKSLLVLEANASYRAVLQAIFSRWGANIQFSENVADAKNQLDKTDFDYLFLDWQFGNDELKALLEWLKGRQAKSIIKTVLVTPIDTSEQVEEMSRAIVDVAMTKPITSSGLINAFNALRAISPSLSVDADVLDKIPEPDNLDANKIIHALIVEDNKVNQLVAQTLLKERGVTSDTAENGVEAIQVLSEAPEDKYQLVFMDCQMPEMDGYEATSEIRRGRCGERYQKIPIIAMTANAMKGDREKCLQAGMDDYIAKPIESDILSEKLKEWS